jgi:hypothetical protein
MPVPGSEFFPDLGQKDSGSQIQIRIKNLSIALGKMILDVPDPDFFPSWIRSTGSRIRNIVSYIFTIFVMIFFKIFNCFFQICEEWPCKLLPLSSKCI